MGQEMGDEKKGKDEKWYYSFLPNNMAGCSTSPLIPLFVTEALGGTVASVGLISAVSSAAAVPANIIWGNLSDTIKKRRMFVLIGFGGLALALLLMAVSTNIGGYLFANFMLGLLASASAPVGTVLILESFEREEWAKRLGDFSRVSGIGWLVGLVLGTIWLAAFNDGGDPTIPMRALFAIAAGLSLVSMILAYFLVPEPEEKIDRHTIDSQQIRSPMMFERARYMPSRMIHILKISGKNLKMRNFPVTLQQYYVVTFLIFTGFLCFYVAFPIFLRNYAGVSNSDVFIIYIASSLVSAITYSQAGRWVTRFGGKRIQMFSISCRIVLFPAMFLVTLLGLSMPMLVLVFCILHALLGFCWANISVAGSTIVSNICYKGFRAESTGMYNAVVGIATIGGALIGGVIAQFMGYLPVFLTSSIFLVAGVVLLWKTQTDHVPSDTDGPECSHI